jgi:type IV secretion system protein VirB11
MADLFSFAAQQAQGRRRQMLRTAFGPAIGAALADPHVIEVMLNPDGRLWLDKVGKGRIDTGERIEAAEAERIIRLVAAHMRREVHDKAPIVSAELPESGERFEGLVPPIVTAPCFAIRKPAEVLYRLTDYVTARILTPRQASALETAVRERKNIVVAGGTSSGKTTLVNALLAEVAAQDERVVILEDTRELRCAAADCVALVIHSPGATIAYVRDLLAGRAPRILGHNPLAGMMVLALMASLIAAGASGWLITTDAYRSARWLEEAHEALASLTLGLVIIHVAAVFLMSAWHGENLVRAMITGRKRRQ